MRIRSYLGKAGLVVVLVLLLACCASGQVTSTIQGMISDPSGAAIAWRLGSGHERGYWSCP